jgi:hypothetical protein
MHLDGDLAVVLEVLRQVHGRHAAYTELPLDRVAIGERQAEPVLGIGHEVPSVWRRNFP